jgi:hypothetical protein
MMQINAAEGEQEHAEKRPDTSLLVGHEKVQRQRRAKTTRRPQSRSSTWRDTPNIMLYSIWGGFSAKQTPPISNWCSHRGEQLG